MTCIPRAPQSPDELLALVNACATAAGGPDWPATALLGAVTAVVLFVLAALVGAVIARAGL
jgi:hypothetical protein